jgi:hypothetical protein
MTAPAKASFDTTGSSLLLQQQQQLISPVAVTQALAAAVASSELSSHHSPREDAAVPMPQPAGKDLSLPLALLSSGATSPVSSVKLSSTTTNTHTTATATTTTTTTTELHIDFQQQQQVLPATPQVNSTLPASSPFHSAVSERLVEENLKSMLVQAASKHSSPVKELAVAVDSTETHLEEKLVASSSEEEQEDAVEYSFAWSVATQKGYRYANAYNRAGAAAKLDIHAEMEDMHYPAQDQTPNNVHPLTGQTYQLFMLADGHGGHACARFAVERYVSCS